LLRLGSRTSGLAAPSSGLGSRLLQGAIESTAVDFGLNIRGNIRPNLRTGSTSFGSCLLSIPQIQIRLLGKTSYPAATPTLQIVSFFAGTGTTAIAVHLLLKIGC